MNATRVGPALDRRTFLRGMVGWGGALMLAGCSGEEPGDAAAVVNTVPDRDRLGIQLHTVRDVLAADFRGTLSRLAEIGYREVEPTDYGGMTPVEFRAALDDVGLTAPSTHASVVLGPELEERLAGYQLIGHRYSRANPVLPGTSPDNPPPATVETWQRRAAAYNEIGEIARPYGIRIIIHNHTAEFRYLEGTTLRPFDILLAETEPELVAWQLDIGWSSVAGMDAVQLFHDHPGRFVSWHVKDVSGLRALSGELSIEERRQATSMARIGEGDIDWPAIVAHANISGVEHIFVEIEGEAVADGSIEASAAAFRYLSGIVI